MIDPLKILSFLLFVAIGLLIFFFLIGVVIEIQYDLENKCKGECRKIIKNVDCFDRFGNRIIGQTCEKTRVCGAGWLLPKCREDD